MDPSAPEFGMELSGMHAAVAPRARGVRLIAGDGRQPPGEVLAVSPLRPPGQQAEDVVLTDANEEAGLSPYIVASRFYK